MVCPFMVFAWYCPRHGLSIWSINSLCSTILPAEKGVKSYYKKLHFCRWKEEAGSEHLPLVFPRVWMLPHLPTTISQLMRDRLGLFPTTSRDPAIVRVIEPTTSKERGLEVTLDTSQYRPDELSISMVVEGREDSNLVLVVVGCHAGSNVDDKRVEGKKKVATEWR